ncbi:MAG: hypothetical protein J0M15_05975 [Deltaproteobacteria bacterium]|nr:hypothetical protein [Deltaproteobacteria bacterium]
MCKKSLWFVILFFFSYAPLSSFAKIELYKIKNKNPLDVELMKDFKVINEKELFQEVSKDIGVPLNAFSFYVELEVPARLTLEEVTAKTGRISWSGRNIKFTSSFLENEIEIKDSMGVKLRIKLTHKFDKTQIFYHQCGSAFPELKVEKENSPNFAVGVNCIERPQKPKAIVISVPEDAEIVSSSFFDYKGKGERWRLYELPNTNNADRVIGSILIKHKGDYKFEILAANAEYDKNQKFISGLQTEIVNLKEKIDSLTDKNKTLSASEKSYILKLAAFISSTFDVNFALGMDSLSLQIENADYGNTKKSSSSFAAQVYARSKLLANKYQVSVGSSTTLPYGVSEEKLEYFDFNTNFGYLLYQKKFNILANLLTSYRSFSHPFSNTAIQVGQMGLGLHFSYNINEFHKVDFSVGSQSLGSNVIKGHTMLKLGYSYTFIGIKPWELGIYYEKQSLNVRNSSGLSRKADLDQLMFNLQF